MDFNRELNNYQAIVKKELRNYIDYNVFCDKNITEDKYKYFYPVLMMSTYKMFKDNVMETIKLAMAIEIIHRYSAIKEEISKNDNSILINEKYINNKPIMISDLNKFLNNSYDLMYKYLKQESDANIFRKIEALGMLSESIDKIILGKYVEDEYRDKKITGYYLDYMYKCNTGALVKATVQIGATLAEAPREDIVKLGEFAEKIGLAYEIKNKSTFILAYDKKEREEILDLSITEALEILKTYGKKAEFLRRLTLSTKE